MDGIRKTIDQISFPLVSFYESFNLRIEQLNESTEKLFLEYIEYQNKYNSSDRNKSWFIPLLAEYKRRYDLISLILYEEDNQTKIASFSGIESITYPQNMSRIITRFFVDPIFRNHHIKDYKETYLQTRALSQQMLKQLAKKLNYQYNHDWRLLDDMYYVCPGEAVDCNVECWQNIIMYSLDVSRQFPLPSISKDTWKKLFGNFKKPH